METSSGTAKAASTHLAQVLLRVVERRRAARVPRGGVRRRREEHAHGLHRPRAASEVQRRAAVERRAPDACSRAASGHCFSALLAKPAGFGYRPEEFHPEEFHHPAAFEGVGKMCF